MLLGNDLDFSSNEAQNIVIHNVSALTTNPKNGMIVYLTAAGSPGLYLRKEGNWIHLGQMEALQNGAIQITPVSGVQYLSVKIDNDTIKINVAGNLEVGANSIGITEIDTANVRVTDLSNPNKNFAMANYKITGLGTPDLAGDAANKEYVDFEIANKIASTGVLVDDWAGPGYPTVGSGVGGSIKKGDWWRISTDFVLGTKELEVGDALFSKANSPGTVATNWFALQNNVGEATSTALGLVRVSASSDLTATNGANATRVVRIGDLLLRTATTDRTGLIQLATQSEMNTGTNAVKAVTPNILAVYVNSKIASTGFAANIGDGTANTFSFTHNFNTFDVQVNVMLNSGDRNDIITDVRRPTTNSVAIDFASAPTVSGYRVTIKKIL